MIQYGGGEALLFGMHKKNSLRSVMVDKEQGRVYVGGISEFGYFVPSTANSLEYVCLSDSLGDDRHIGNIWGIYPYQSTVIAQGDVEIVIYDETKRTSTKVDTGCKLDCSNFIDGILWLGTDRGLKFLMGTSVIDAPGAGELKGQRIRAILPVRKMLLVVTANNGVFRYDRNVLTRLEAASKAAMNLGEVFCADIHADMLALGSIDGGLGIVNLTSGQMTVYNESNGLPNNTVLTTKFDICGDLWAGVDPGIAKIRMTLPVETLSNKSLPIGSGYVIETVGNKMYIGTNRGLFYVDYIPGMDLSNAVFHRGCSDRYGGFTKPMPMNCSVAMTGASILLRAQGWLKSILQPDIGACSLRCATAVNTTPAHISVSGNSCLRARHGLANASLKGIPEVAIILCRNLRRWYGAVMATRVFIVFILIRRKCVC